MREFLTTLLIAAAIVTVMFGGFYLYNKDSVIALPGYEHAVIACDYSLTVNSGHYNDPQVQELIELAKEECPKE